MVPSPLSKKLTIVVIGRSGSGKGTQAEFLLKHLGKDAHHVETGRILRHLLTRQNATTRIANHIMKIGGLFPSWFGAYAWLRELIEEGCADKHLVFDGAPRKIEEAELLDDVMKWHGRQRAWCVYVDVPEKDASLRLLARGRDDDHPEAIKNRMRFFKKDVLPVIAHYAKQKRLIHINGNKPMEEVWREIDKALAKKLKQLWLSQ